MYYVLYVLCYDIIFIIVEYAEEDQHGYLSSTPLDMEYDNRQQYRAIFMVLSTLTSNHVLAVHISLVDSCTYDTRYLGYRSR